MLSYGVGVWKAIRIGWDNFLPHCSLKVGIGDGVNFCRHRWCREEPVEVAFPAIARIASYREVPVNGCFKVEVMA